MTINGKKYPLLWLFLLAWNAYDIPIEAHRHSWMWLVADVVAGATCALVVHRGWPRGKETGSDEPGDSNKPNDIRDIWKNKFDR